MKRRLRLGHAASFFALASLLIADAFILKWNALRSFDLFDMSTNLDSFWRVFCGQRPYVDFIYISGPLHIQTNLLFLRLFGFNTLGLWVALTAFSWLAILTTFFCARKRLVGWDTALVTALTAVSFNWAWSHPWYDPSAHLWTGLALLLLSRSTPFANASGAWRAGLGVGVCSALALMTKTNIGLIALLGFSVVILTSSFKKNSLFGFSVGFIGAIGLILWLWVPSPKVYWDQVIVEWGLSQLRMRPSFFFSYAAPLFPYLLLAVLVGLTAILTRLPFSRQQVFWAGFWILLASNATGSTAHAVNVPLLGLVVALGFLAVGNNPRAKIALRILAFTFLCLHVYFGATKAAWGSLSVEPRIPLTRGPLKGWRLTHTQYDLLNGYPWLIQSKVKTGESLLILTDLQILYLLSNRESYRGIPYGFLTGELPVEGTQREGVRDRIKANPPDWVLIHTETGKSFVNYLPLYLELDRFLKDSYEVNTTFKGYALLKKKKA